MAGSTRSPADWAAQGVRDMNGRAVPDYGAASILIPAGAGGPAFMVFRNFTVITPTPYPGQKETEPFVRCSIMIDGADAVQYPFADEGITTSIRDATLSGQPYPIKGWFVYSTNLMQALPNEQATIKAMQQLDLLVDAIRDFTTKKF